MLKEKIAYYVQEHKRLDRKFWQRTVNYKRGCNRVDKTSKENSRDEKQNNKKLNRLISSVFNKTKQKPSQLGQKKQSRINDKEEK